MSDILTKIERTKREEIAAAKARLSADRGRGPRRAAHSRAVECVRIRDKLEARALCDDRGSEEASPSKGLIRADFDPPVLARAYEAAARPCLSVLTDTHSFQGHLDFHGGGTRGRPICRCCARISCSTLSGVEARAHGADCILIIHGSRSARPRQRISRTRRSAIGMGWADRNHTTAPNSHRALKIRSRLIGVNNANLATFATTCRPGGVAPMIPNDA